VNDETKRDEIAIEEIARLLEGTELESALNQPADDEREVLRREWVEVLGLLPYGLEPVAPSPELKERILAATGAQVQPSKEHERSDAAAVAPFHRPATERGSRTTRWLLPLAASLAVLLLGSSAFLYLRLEKQRATITRLSQRLEAASAQQSDLVRLQSDLQLVSTRLAHMTAPGVEICPLRPQGERTPRPDAWGALYLAPSSDRWYLTVRGLEPCPQGKVYRIWLVTSERPVQVAEFKQGVEAVIEIETALASDEMTGVLVTLEAAEGSDVPSGSTVLFGDEKMRVL
jgi:hypothetical protein